LTLTEHRDRSAFVPWRGDTRIDFGDVELDLCLPPELYERETVGNHFIVGKTRSMVERLLAEVGASAVERAIDVGVYKGGSVVLYHKLFAPKKLVGIDLATAPLPPLDEYAARQTDGSVVVARGVDQADTVRLDRICAEHFGQEPLDFVADDASHLHAETRATFRALFPRLRPGGLYVIEDWSWAHWAGDFWQKQRGGAHFHDKRPMSDLVIELVLMCASSPQIVSGLRVYPDMIFVKRGPAPVEPGFEPSEHTFCRGEPTPQFGAPGDRARYQSPTLTFGGR
jgi:hypothetical protein